MQTPLTLSTQDYDGRPIVPHIQTQPTPYYQSPAHYVRPHTQRSPQVPHGHSQHYPPQTHPKPTYQHRSYSDASLSLPTVISFHPASGQEGSTFTVYVQSQTDLTADSRVFKFMFGSFRCNATPGKSEDRPSGVYTLMGHVPSSTLTGWIAAQVTVYLVIEDEEGQELHTAEIGTFTYTDVPTQPAYSPAGKRKRSIDAEDRGSSKRPTSQPLIRPKGEDYGVYSYTASGGSNIGYSTYVTLIPDSGNSTSIVPTDFPPSSQYATQSSPRNYTYNGYPASTETQAQAIVAPQHLPHWAHPYSTPGAGSSVTGSIPPQSVAGSSSKMPPPTQSSQESNPPLVRTSTLQTHQNTTGSGPGSFNPYGIYPHTSKAVLNIDGDLDSVAASPWTQEEIENKRKIVQFWRTQKGATINTNFAVVSTNERQPNSICISCIYWEEKGECYVTSVDCIYLLESLISVRFTVEEKNRIRRNLEGFRPMTVSKAKADSENFFKLIMAFPSPKPRNIEKDVKVFPWKILGMALKKIIGKYVSSSKIINYYHS